MNNRLFNFFHKEFKSINQAALLLGVFAFFSQILALVRDRAFAHIFGPSPLLDIYYASFRIPDFLYVTIASLFAVTALLPLLGKKYEENNEEARNFFASVIQVYSLCMMIIVIVMYCVMPYIVPVITPGFTVSEQSLLIHLSRIMLLSPFLMGLSNIFASVTQMYKKFFVYALTPVMYNIGILLGILIGYPHWGISGLAYGVVFGALLHAGLQLPIIWSHGFRLYGIQPGKYLKDIGILLRTSLPRTLGLATYNIILLVVVTFASLLGSGVISIFNLSFNLQNVPLVLIGLSYSVASFPIVTQLFVQGKRLEFFQTIEHAARQIIFWSIPLTVVCIVLRAHIVRIVLGTGNFDWSDTRLTAASLALFSVSLVAQGLILLFVRAYYAAGYTWRPLRINIISMVVTITSMAVFLYLFHTSQIFQFFVESLLRVQEIPSTIMLMLPAAFSLGVILNMIWLLISFKKDFPEMQLRHLGKTFVQSLGASVLVGTGMYILLQVWSWWTTSITFWDIFIQGTVVGIVGLVGFIIILKLLGNEEIKEIISAVRTKFWKTSLLQESQADL